MAERPTVIEGVGGVGLGLIAAAMAGLGVPKIVWVFVLVIGVALFLAALIQWFVAKRRKRGEGGGRYTPPRPIGDPPPGAIHIDYGTQAPGSGGHGGPGIGPGARGGDGGGAGDHNVWELDASHIKAGETLTIVVPEGAKAGINGAGKDGDDVVVTLPDGRELRTKGGKAGADGFHTDPAAVAIPGSDGGPGMTILRYTLTNGMQHTEVFTPKGRLHLIASPGVAEPSGEVIWEILKAPGGLYSDSVV